MRPGSFVVKINIFLSLSAIALAGYLTLVQIQPYSPAALSVKNLKLERLGLIGKESNAMLKGAYAFDVQIFKKRHLFSEPVKKNAQEATKTFILLGVSVGDKNLAMIRDVTENKDYYCVEGDKIGAFRVKQIFKDKVVLESEGLTLEISR